jgi:hypothetical protein
MQLKRSHLANGLKLASRISNRILVELRQVCCIVAARIVRTYLVKTEKYATSRFDLSKLSHYFRTNLTLDLNLPKCMSYS